MRPRRGLVVLLLALTACSVNPSATVPTPAPSSSPVAASRVSVQAVGPAPQDAPPATVTPRPSARPLTGRTVVVDPGHNGRWTTALNHQVPAGNGRTKPCNSSGTASTSGYPEHRFTWDLGQRLARALQDLGAKVVLTRPNDQGSGPCVNVRAAITNAAKADLLVSLHADGASPGVRGFHIIVSTSMVGGTAVETGSLSFAKVVRNQLEGTGMPRSTYIGGGTALSLRTDIAGLNLSERVGVMLELGNMRSASDLALQTNPHWRQRCATALATAAVTALG